MATKDKKMNIRIEGAKRDKFYTRCRRNGLTPADIICRMVDDFLAGRIKYTPTRLETK